MTPFMTARRDIERGSGGVQGDKPAKCCQRHGAENEQRLAQDAEPGIEQDHHQPENQAEDQRQPRFRPPLVLELSSPFNAVFVGIERHLFVDLLVGVSQQR